MPLLSSFDWDTRHLPPHWIGVRRGWKRTCQSLHEALVSLPPGALATHALVVGATGSGKTNLLHHLIAQDLLLGHSLVVLDARGDLASAALELAARADLPPERVRFFNLREKVRPWGFNPLSGAGEPYYRALGVLEAVAAESESWGVQIAETMRNAVLLLAEAGRTLTEIEALFYNRSLRSGLMAQCASTPVRAFWERYGELSPDRQASLATPVLNKVSLLMATEGLRRLYGHPEPVDLAERLNAPGSLTLVSLAVDELHGAGWMTGKLFLASLCREVFARVGTPESHRNPVRLYVDEFEHFGMTEFEAVLAEGRRFKLSLVLAHQTLAQLTPKMRAMLLGNVGAKVVFRAGRQDAETLNRDLTGDPKAFDLAELATGRAVLWQRDDEPIQIEVNLPLIEDVGAVSPLARAYRTRLRRLAPRYRTEATSPAEAGNESEAGVTLPGSRLEDWL